MSNPKAAIVIIGNEILSGRTLDTNTNTIVKALNNIGIIVNETRTIPDNEDIIIETVRELSSKYDYVFTTGGIGPTHDDITSQALSRAFGVKYCRHPEAYKIVKELYESRGQEVTPAREKMAYTPQGAELILNEGTPPGFSIENVYVLAGVPLIMESMLKNILPTLKRGEVIESRQLEIMVGESKIATMFEELQHRYPKVDMGSYPFIKNNQHGTALVLRSSNYELLDKAYKELEELVNLSK